MKNRVRFFISALCLLVQFNFSPMVCSAGSGTVIITKDGPFCGIYCVYAALHFFGKGASIADLYRTDYIGSPKGSSLRELKHAIEDKGLHANIWKNLNTADLAGLPGVLLLHVKSSIDRNSADHFVLLIGTGTTRILYNPPQAPQSINLAEISPVWSGACMQIANNEEGLSDLSPLRFFIRVFPLVAAVLLILLLHAVLSRYPTSLQKKKRTLNALLAPQFCTIFLATIIGQYAYHTNSANGFFTHTETLAEIQRVMISKFLPKVTKRDCEALLQNGALAVDARLSRDFNQGHIENAMNLPVNAEREAFQDFVSRTKKDRQIILYCQSNACTFAGDVAARLHREGFANLCIYKGGWEEWKSN